MVGSVASLSSRVVIAVLVQAASTAAAQTPPRPRRTSARARGRGPAPTTNWPLFVSPLAALVGWLPPVLFPSADAEIQHPTAWARHLRNGVVAPMHVLRAPCRPFATAANAYGGPERVA